MKHIYGLCVCLAAFALNVKAQDNYIPSIMGNNVPSPYDDARERTSFAFRNTDPNTSLAAPVRLTDLFATAGNGAVQITWRTDYEPNLKRYEIEYSKDNITYQQVGVVNAGIYLNGRAYTFRHNPVNARDRVFYRIRYVAPDGKYDYSPVISQVISGNVGNSVFPTVVNSGMVSLNLNDTFQLVQIVDMQGKILQTVNLNGKTGRTDIALSRAAQGVCFVRVLGTQHNNQPRQNIVQKVFIQ